MKDQLTFNHVMKKQALAVNLLLSFVVFVLMVTSAPLPQFKGKGITSECTLLKTDTTVSPDCGASRITCVTVWGSKAECSQNPYEYTPTGMTCSVPKQLLQTSEAFYILGVVASLTIFIITGFSILDYLPKSSVVVLSVVNVAFTLIPWACMTALWYKDYCGGSKVEYDYYGKPNGIPFGSDLQASYNRSAAYILTIAAWCIQVISVVCLVVM